MPGYQSKGLRVSAETKGWDPTPAWFNPQMDAPPDAGNNSYLPNKGALPENQPNPDENYNNPELNEKVSWSHPKPSMGADSKKGGNPYEGMPM